MLVSSYRLPSLKCMSFFIVSVVSGAFSVLCVYSKFGHHPRPLRYLCAKFHFFCDLRCWASPQRKTAYSLTQLICAYSINQSPSLSDARKPKFPLQKSQQVVCIVVLLEYKIHMNTSHTLVITLLLCCINLTANEYGAVLGWLKYAGTVWQGHKTNAKMPGHVISDRQTITLVTIKSDVSNVLTS